MIPTDVLLLLKPQGDHARRLQSPAGQWVVSRGEPVHGWGCSEARNVARSQRSPFGWSSLNRSMEHFSSANPTLLLPPKRGKEGRLCQAEIQLFSSKASPHFQKH